jgi:NAD(P)H-hydrate epimerase
MQYKPLPRAVIRELDRRAIEDFGVPGMVLMENASRGLAEHALRVRAAVDHRPVLIAVGAGNNGGDGFAAARHLHNRGVPVRILLCTPPDRLRGDALVNYDIACRMRLPMVRGLAGDGQADRVVLAAESADCGMILDALLGTGLDRPVGEPLRTVIEQLNDARRPIVAADLPSGLDADTGAVLGVAVRAWMTVSFVAPKPGFSAPGAAAYTGRVEVVREIGIPRELIEEAERLSV